LIIIGQVFPLSAFFLLQSATTPELTNAAARHILTLIIQNASVEYMKLTTARSGADCGQ